MGAVTGCFANDDGSGGCGDGGDKSGCGFGSSDGSCGGNISFGLGGGGCDGYGDGVRYGDDGGGFGFAGICSDGSNNSSGSLLLLGPQYMPGIV